MATEIALTGFPEVAGVDIFQASRSESGRIVVDTLISGSAVVTTVPFVSTLTITTTANTFTWANIRMVKRPRVYGAFMRTVFEDSRWKLREVVLVNSYNQRDCNGVLYPETEKTLTELIAILAAASGLTITGASLPAIKPLAAWRNKTAASALEELLERTGCRMVYRPTTGGYTISPGDNGSITGLEFRTYRQPPDVGIRNLIVATAPITHEARLDCTAVVRGTGNVLETVVDPHLIFENFDSIVDAGKKRRYQQSALRLWKPDLGTSKMLLGRRALTLTSGDEHPIYCSPYFINVDLAAVPAYSHMVAGEDQQLSLTAGGTVFQCAHPRVVVEAASTAVKTTAQVLCAYYDTSTGVPARDSVSVSIDATASNDLTIIQDWIRPVSSTESEIDTTEWDALLDAVATAIAARYTHVVQHVESVGIGDTQGVGIIGAVRYTAKLGPQADIRMAFAVNFEPTDARML